MIPATAHFIWYGTAFPWVNALAIRSACIRGGFERVILHHDGDLSGNRYFEELKELEQFVEKQIDVDACVKKIDCSNKGIKELHDSLKSPAARANMYRILLLASEGGVYLDMDTITLQSFDNLREAKVFCGAEYIAFPAHHVRSKNPFIFLYCVFLSFLRGCCRIIPNGWQTFRKLQSLYTPAVNNAVVGSESGHSFMFELLEAMVNMDEKRKYVRFALGTHLLQEKVAQCPDVKVHQPNVFFPLGPVISQHWFRTTQNPDVEKVLFEDTYLIHWYASVETKSLIPNINPDYVKKNAGSQLFSKVAEQFL